MANTPSPPGTSGRDDAPVREPAHHFATWVPPFSADIFVQLVAYADESGAHVGPSSDVLIVAGYVAPRDDWTRFSAEWRSVLKRFSAPYFHFREWYAASAVVRKKREPSSDFKKNPFKSWDQSRLDDFILELAELAAFGNRLIIGGYVPAKLLHQDKLSGTVTTDDGPRELCVDHFFNSVVSTVNRQRPPWKRLPITFFFDHSQDRQWKRLVNDGFHLNRGRNPRFRQLDFAHKEDHLPLQAADMVAYRLRQRIEKHVSLDFSDSTWPKLDNVLFRSMDEWSKKLSPEEADAVIRRFFVIK